MLHYYNFTDKIIIHPEFPKDILVDVFKPYMFYYYMIMYGIKGTEKINLYKNILYKKLNDFYNYNKTFGRKIFIASRNRGIKQKSSFFFDSKHIDFFHITAIQNVGTYFNSDFDSDAYVDSDSDSDSDSNSNSNFE